MSIYHTVFLKLKPEVSLANFMQLMDQLKRFAKGIPGCLDLHAGQNISVEGVSQGYNFALTALFKDEKARDAYLVDPEHLALAGKIVECTVDGVQGVIVCDIASK
ncbi:MAG: Dabb family protein [Gammaproteobacteria bacterium]